MIFKPDGKLFNEIPGVKAGMKFLCISSTYYAYETGKSYTLSEDENIFFLEEAGCLSGYNGAFVQIVEKSQTQLELKL